MQELMATIGWPDRMAPAFFLLCWTGYVFAADGRLGGRATLMSRMHQYRELWMQRLLARENRIADLAALSVLTQSNAFLASSCVLIVGG